MLENDKENDKNLRAAFASNGPVENLAIGSSVSVLAPDVEMYKTSLAQGLGDAVRHVQPNDESYQEIAVGYSENVECRSFTNTMTNFNQPYTR